MSKLRDITEMGTNFLIGYTTYHAYTTFNVLTDRFIKKNVPEKSFDYEYASIEELTREDRNELSGFVGFVSGLSQDVCSVGLAAGYIFGKEDLLGKICAEVIAAKVFFNIASLVVDDLYCVYKGKFNKN